MRTNTPKEDKHACQDDFAVSRSLPRGWNRVQFAVVVVVVVAVFVVLFVVLVVVIVVVLLVVVTICPSILFHYDYEFKTIPLQLTSSRHPWPWCKIMFFQPHMIFVSVIAPL